MEQQASTLESRGKRKAAAVRVCADVGAVLLTSPCAVFRGSHIAVHMENAWFVAGTTATRTNTTGAHAPPPAHKPLVFVSSKAHTGAERVLGAFTATTISWSTSASKVVDFVTTCKTFAAVADNTGSAVVFEATFPTGAQNTAVPGATSEDGVLLNW